MFTLNATSHGETFQFYGPLPELIKFSQEWEHSVITDCDGVEVYSLDLPAAFKLQAI